MSEFEKVVLKSAAKYSNPNEFISSLKIENLPMQPNEKGHLFLQAGATLYNRSYFVLALHSWEKALKYFAKTQDRANESACYLNLGFGQFGLGNFRRAIDYSEKSLKIAREIGDRAVESKCYGNLGVAYHMLGDFRKVIEYQEKSLKIAREIGDRAVESKCYTNLGIAYNDLGDFRRAIKYYEKSLKIKMEIGDRAGESKCYGSLGNAHKNLGDFRRAIEYYEKSLKIAREIGDRAVESKCYGNLGVAYHMLGDFRKVIEYQEKSLQIDKKLGDRAGEAKCYTNLGVAYRNQGNFRRAIDYSEKSLKIAREIGDRAEQAKCYSNLGIAYDRMGDSRRAIKYYEKSLKITVEIGDRAGELKCYTNLGVAYRNQGNFGRAIEYYEKALQIARELGEVESERVISFNLGIVHYESNPKSAYDHLSRSVELSELIGERLVEERHKIGFQAQASNAFQVMVPLCVKLEREKEAFEYAERGKSRAFLDLLAATEIKPTINLTAELESLLNEEEEYLIKLREIQTRHLRRTKVSVEPGEVEGIFENLNLIYDKLDELDPEYVFTRRGKPLSLDKLQEMLSSQKGNVVLIEYFTTEKETFIFLVSSKELHIKTAPLSRKQLSRYLEKYQREVVNHLKFGDVGDSWLELSKYLIEPISEYLHEGDLIYFVPYGLLHYLPLHALELRGEPLIRSHPVAYAPSASLIKFCQNKGSGRLKSCASFGVVFWEEAEDVAELFGAESCLHDLTTRAEVRRKCVDKDVIHFSCHGYFDNLDPLSSGVELYDGVLTAREIFDMRLGAELVTLSACQTGLNNRSPGDELIGLTRAFLYAGSPSVLVSLWSVDARSTHELMLEFYRLLKNGADKAGALQEAQKRIMGKREYSHPYYWAPFILIGDWK